MKTTSTEFKNLAENQNGARYYHKITVDDIEIEEDINDFRYNSMCNDYDSFSIGNTCSATVSFSIKNPSVNLTNNEIKVYEGIDINGTIEYIKLGIFKVLKPNKDREVVNYECVDRMIYLMNMPYFSNLEVPTTDIAVLEEICSQVGIKLTNKNLVSHTISTVPEGYTRREIITYMSSLQGKNAIINDEGNLELIWYKETEYVVDDDKIYSDGTADINDETDYTVGYIECTVRSFDGKVENTLKSGSGTTGIKILNPFMTQTILDEVFDAIDGFSFRPCSFDFLGDFRLEVGDIVTVNTNGQTYIVPIMQLDQISDGGVVTTITSIAETNSENEIDLTGPTIKSMERYYAELVLINQAMINKLTVDEADARYISVDKIDAITLTVEKAVVEKLSADFADIHLANIDVADIGKFYADSGLLKDVTIVDGHITGELNAVRINADVIKSGTLTVDRLLVTGKNSIVYQINVNSSGLSLEELSDEKYQKYINGTDIVANSITANQIATKSITADQIDVESIFAQDITATGTITGATILGATIGADSGYIGCMSINELGRLIVDIDGDPPQIDDYILMEYEARNVDMTINGTSGLTPRGLHTYRQYSYSNIIGTINTNPYDRYNTETVLTSDGFRITNNYYDGTENVGTLYSSIDFTTEKVMNTIYTICDFRFDKVTMDRLEASSIVTKSGANLDTINNNLSKYLPLSGGTVSGTLKVNTLSTALWKGSGSGGLIDSISVTITGTVSASSTATLSGRFTIPTGYSSVGIIGYNLTTYSLVPVALNVAGNTVSIAVRNIITTSVTVSSAKAIVLLVKNTT